VIRTALHQSLAAHWQRQSDDVDGFDTHTGASPIMPPLPFILIADDYALTDGVSRAIVELLAADRLSGTSVMTNQPRWSGLAAALAPFAAHREIGLHVTLTLGSPLGPMPNFAPGGVLPSLGQVLQRSFTGQQVREEITDEIARQIEAFQAHFGRLPDFIDGHQHVHVLPVIRGALFDAVERTKPGWRPWLRDPSDRLGAILARGVSVGKSLFIAALAQGFASAARKRGYRLNDSFSGVSAFDPQGDFAADFRRYILVSGKDHLVMCHPGHSDEALAALDPVTDARDLEYIFLRSDAFTELLKSMNMRVGRFGDSA